MEDRLIAHDEPRKTVAGVVESQQAIQRSEIPVDAALVVSTAGASLELNAAELDNLNLDNNESRTAKVLRDDAQHDTRHDHALQQLLQQLSERPFLPAQQEIANSLLQLLSDSTPPQLVQHIPAISLALSRSLHVLQPSANVADTSSNSNRLASAYLNILRHVFRHCTSLPSDIVSPIVLSLSYWCYHAPRSHSAARRISTLDSSLALGSAGAFGKFGASPTKRSATSSKRNSVASLSETESESESSHETRWSTGQVRLDSLKCLEILATYHSKLLYQHWSLFIPDSRFARLRKTLFTLIESDPVPSVRLQAATALEAMLQASSAYLAIADDKPSKASFTSLSSKLSEIISESHIKTAALLSLPSTLAQPPILLSILRLAATLGKNSPYQRLDRQLPAPLSRAIIPLVSHDLVGIAALDALCAIISSSSQDLASSAISSVDVVKIFDAMLKLNDDQEAGVRAAACRGLGFIVKLLAPDNRRRAFRALSDRCKVAGTVGAASWALANTADFLEATDFKPSSVPVASESGIIDHALLDLGDALRLAISLAVSAQGERIQTNGMRCVGSLLKISLESTAVLDTTTGTYSTLLGEAVGALCEGLRSINPKVRWNAAAATGGFLCSQTNSTSTRASSLASYSLTLVESLARSLVESDNYKVKIQSVIALSTCRDSAFGGRKGIERVLDVLVELGKALQQGKDVERRGSEVSHLLLLEKKLEYCIDRLSGL